MNRDLQIAIDNRSRHPIFKGQRFVVFDWMLEDLCRTLGVHTEAFDLHAWFYDLDANAVKSSLVLPKAEQWPWLQRALVTECVRRGLPVVKPTNSGSVAPLDTWDGELAAWMKECQHDPRCLSSTQHSERR